MRSSDRVFTDDSRRSELSRRLLAFSLIAASAAAISFVRPALAVRFHKLKTTSDTFAMPSPEQTVVASLGYRSALADLIYGHVLVSYGLHFQEKRRYEFVGDYLDVITTLDPLFRDPYRFADTLLVMQPEPAREEDYDKAREILERGLKNRPYDSELWLTAGQYMAYLARPFLKDEKKKEEWKLRGAKILARACELASDNENIPYHCIAAATLLDRSGEREAAIESLKRIIAVNDDPEIERLALGYLEKRLSERERERQERRKQAFNKVWRDDLPFVKKDLVLVLGPHLSVGECAGPARADDPRCATTWKEWSHNLERQAAPTAAAP